MDSLLPANATAWERVLERVSGERWPLDTDIIRRVKSPWECPARLLPYLAYELSVDLWGETWPVAKKRAVIARSVGLASIKGTEAGISEAVEIMGGKVLSVITPPAKTFLTVSRSPQEKAAWLAKMPQLRIYPLRRPDPVPGLYVGGAPSGFLRNSTAFFAATPRVTIWRQGIETELLTLERRREDPTIVNAEEFVQAREPAGYAGLYVSGPPSGFLLKSTARQRIYTVRTRRTLAIPGSDRLAAQFAAPSLDPIDVRWVAVREAGPVLGPYSGAAIAGVGPARYLRNSRARERVFKRIHLLDPDVPGQAGTGRVFLGYNTRFGEPPYHAELTVEIKHSRPPAAFMPGAYGYLVAPDRTASRRVYEAVVTHKSLRDRVLVATRTHDVVTASVGVFAGAVAAGQIVAV